MRIKRTHTSAVFLAGSLATALIATTTAHGDSATWTGAAADGNLWSNVNNWSGPPAAVPGAGETATFDIGSAGGTIDLGAGVTISRLTFNASAPSLTIGAGAVNSQTLDLTNTGDGINGAGASAGTTLGTTAEHTDRRWRFVKIVALLTGCELNV